MELIKRITTLILAATALLAMSCESPSEEETPQSMDVTYSALDGAWQLTAWQGKPLAEGLYCYVAFNGETRRFEMHDNLGSMYDNLTTGSFSLEQDDTKRYIISGTYDNGVGDWNSAYVVTMPKGGDSMIWSSTTSDDLSTYIRIDAIPEL